MTALLSTRERVFAAIQDYRLFYDVSPSLREIAEITGLRSVSTVRLHLDALREQGRITWDDRRARSVRVVAG